MWICSLHCYILQTIVCLSIVESKCKFRCFTQHQSFCVHVSCFNVQDRRELEKIPTMNRRVKFSLWLMRFMQWLTPFIIWTRISVLTIEGSVRRWSKLGERSCWSTSATLISMVSLQISMIWGILTVGILCFLSYVVKIFTLKTCLIIWLKIVESIS